MVRCYYHKNCMDGFTAGWAFWRFHPQAEVLPLQYGQDHIPVDEGDVVYFVDVTPSVPLMKSLLKKAAKVVVIDHHETVRDALNEIEDDKLELIFDMNKCGSRLVWDYCQEEFTLHEAVPPLIQYIEDRDLWRWELPMSKELSAALFLEARTFEHWEYLRTEWEELVEPLSDIGIALLTAQAGYVERMRRHAYILPNPQGEGVIAVVNAPMAHISEVLHEMQKEVVEVKEDGSAVQPQLAISWSMLETGEILFGIRGDIDSTRVHAGDFAKVYGGGGHPNAAGFKLPAGSDISRWMPRA